MALNPSALPDYSPSEVSVIWGPVLFEGFSTDSIVSFSYNSDMITAQTGCDGKVARTVTPDRSGTIAIELMQTSPSSAEMSAILYAQNTQADSSNVLRADLVVSDPSGSALCIARDACIQTAPEIGLGIEVGTHEWTLYTPHLEFLPVPKGADLDSTAKIAAVVAGMLALNAR